MNPPYSHLHSSDSLMSPSGSVGEQSKKNKDWTFSHTDTGTTDRREVSNSAAHTDIYVDMQYNTIHRINSEAK